MSRICFFRLGEERYGAPTARVREVVEIDHLARVPHTPPYLLGIGNVRGQALAVLDLQPVAGRASAPRESSLALTVTAGGEPLALAVDEVLSFEHVAAGDLKPLGDDATPELGRCATGRCRTQQGPAVLLDLEALWRELRIGRPAAEAPPPAADGQGRPSTKEERP